MKTCEVPAVTRNITAFALLAVAVFVWATAAAQALRPPGAPDDPFLCYRVRDAGMPRFTPIPGVLLAGPLETVSVRVAKPLWLCTPADVNAEGVTDAATHLEGCKIQPPVAGVLPRKLQLTNEFGVLSAEIGSPDCLLVPTAKSLDSEPPLPAANGVDHYACHRLRLTTDGPPFAHIEGVRVTDQFGTRYVDLMTPRHLCAPVSDNGEGIKNPAGYFVCYRAQPNLVAPQDTLGPVRRKLRVNNQFGPARLDAIVQAELCIPSVRAPGPRGCFSRDSSPTGFDAIVAAGFTVIDTGTDPGVVSSLPAGRRALVWLGNYDNTTCTWDRSDDWIVANVAPLAGNPKVEAYNLADEPRLWQCPSAVGDLAARSALVKSLDPSRPTFAVIQPHFPENPYAPYVGAVDIIGVDRYPCSWAAGCVYAKIDETLGLLEAAKVPRYWAIVQAFADSYYRWPTVEELHEEFRHWRASRMEGYIVFSWAYSGDTLANHPDLVTALMAENGS